MSRRIGKFFFFSSFAFFATFEIHAEPQSAGGEFATFFEGELKGLIPPGELAFMAEVYKHIIDGDSPKEIGAIDASAFHDTFEWAIPHLETFLQSMRQISSAVKSGDSPRNISIHLNSRQRKKYMPAVVSRFNELQTSVEGFILEVMSHVYTKHYTYRDMLRLAELYIELSKIASFMSEDISIKDGDSSRSWLRSWDYHYERFKKNFIAWPDALYTTRKAAYVVIVGHYDKGYKDFDPFSLGYTYWQLLAPGDIREVDGGVMGTSFMTEHDKNHGYIGLDLSDLNEAKKMIVRYRTLFGSKLPALKRNLSETEVTVSEILPFHTQHEFLRNFLERGAASISAILSWMQKFGPEAQTVSELNSSRYDGSSEDFFPQALFRRLNNSRDYANGRPEIPSMKIERFRAICTEFLGLLSLRE